MVTILILLFIIWGAWLSILAVKQVKGDHSSFDAVDNSASLLVLIFSPAFAHALAVLYKAKANKYVYLTHLSLAMGMWFCLLVSLFAVRWQDYLLIFGIYCAFWAVNIALCKNRNKEKSV